MKISCVTYKAGNICKCRKKDFIDLSRVMKCRIIFDARANVEMGDKLIIRYNSKYPSCGSHQQLFALVGIFCLALQCEARSRGMYHIPARDTINYPDLTNSERFETDDRHGKLYKSYSGDPWGSSLISYYENANIRAPHRINVTSNDTENNQLPITSRDEFLSKRRMKRSVVHLYNMVVCATGCNPLAYKGYGCYCGFLGSGYVIDGIDRCCKMHDWCYDATDCPMFMEYFVPYYWRCYHGYKPVCAVEHGEWGSAGSCAQRLCECDRSLAECLRRYPCPSTKAVCTSSPWRLVQNIFMIM